MSRATPDDQLKFLLSCVRHSNNGKIDFIEVAKECGVVSKGAAAKRYERLLKANGIHPSGGTAEKSLVTTPKQKSKADIAKSAAAKRRKIEGHMLDLKVDDEDDFKPFLKSEPQDLNTIKSEPDTGFSTHPFQRVAIHPQQPFFPRPPPPSAQMTTHSPYMPPHSPMHQPIRQRFPPPPLQRPMYPQTPPWPQMQLPRSHPPTPASSSLSRPTTPSHTHWQLQPASKQTTSPTTVTEDQINSMFEEFCSQDMFKMPNFDTPVSSVSSVVANTPSSASTSTPASSTVHTVASEAQSLSPRTDNTSMSGSALQTQTQPQPQQPVVKIHETQDRPVMVGGGVGVGVAEQQQQSGTGIENSILIGD